MNNLEIFQTPEFGTVRTVIREDAPWFVAADVCRILGLSQVSRAMDRLDDDEKGSVKVPHPQSPDKTLEMNGVNEPGLYHLVLCSNKPEAKAFKRWITHEVIPDIRRNGGYISCDETMTDEELLEKALAIAKQKISERGRRLNHGH